MPRFAFTILLALLVSSSVAQRYHFNYKKTGDQFEVRSDGNALYCLFRVSAKKVSPSIFRKVFLDENLKPIDSVDYTINGIADLVGTTTNAKFATHAFLTKIEKTYLLNFIITEKNGMIHSTFTKAGPDFHTYGSKGSVKLKNLQFSFVDDYGSPYMLFMQLRLFSSSGMLPGLMALDIETGKELWTSNAPYLTSIQTTEEKIIGLSHSPGSYASGQDDILQFISKEDGKIQKSVPFYVGRANRNISVITSNGRELLLAGIEYPGNNAKNGQFFLSMFDLSGHLIFDKLDTAARLSSKRMRLMGHVFDKNGNLVLIGEGWKLDATRAIASTAGTILAAAVLGGVVVGTNTQADRKIDKLIFTTVTPDDGVIHDFKVFPIGPYMNDFGRLITDGEHVLLNFRNDVMIFDPNEINTPPKPFTALTYRETLLLAPFGPVVLENNTSRRTITLSLLPPGNALR